MITTKAKTDIFKSFLEIDEDSKVPKYLQLVELFIHDIEMGLVKIGEKIPSINETSEEFYLSRDTVVKAYELLRSKGVITAVKGKGFYVSCTSQNIGKRILLIFNNLGDHKKTIFNSFITNLPDNSKVDLLVHNCDSSILEKMIIENLGKYDHYVIMPHLKEVTESLKQAIRKIPQDKLILVNRDLEDIGEEYCCVFEDLEKDIYEGLTQGLDKIKGYHALHVIFPPTKYYCHGIKYGMIRFCDDHNLDWDISDSTDIEVEAGTVYIVIEDRDLVDIIKEATNKNLVLGKDVGIISYNSTAFKEILAGGISVLSTDFQQMGKTVAEMVLHKTNGKLKNPSYFINRNSI